MCTAGARARGRAASASVLETTEPLAAPPGSAGKNVSFKASKSLGVLSSGELGHQLEAIPHRGIWVGPPRVSPRDRVSNLSPFLTPSGPTHAVSILEGKGVSATSQPLRGVCVCRLGL